MHSTKRLWTPEARARKHLKLGPNTILAIMRHGCSILTATILRSFIRANLIIETILRWLTTDFYVLLARISTCPGTPSLTKNVEIHNNHINQHQQVTFTSECTER